MTAVRVIRNLNFTKQNIFKIQMT